MMGIIKRSFGYKGAINVTSALYSALVRSNLEYSSTVWSPFNCIGALVYSKRAATRCILNYLDLKYGQAKNVISMILTAIFFSCCSFIVKLLPIHL